ncbi:MAG: ABC transporter substrate-binding protein [Planctomycetota bacterium]|jgi:ABC-type transport system substrate-binding protein
MQENPILSVMKLVILAVFTVFFGMLFFQYQSLEEKFVKTRDKVDDLVSSVAEVGRKVDNLAERGVALGTGDGPPPADVDFAGLEEDRKSKASTIRGRSFYPFNPDWTVIADKRANEDRTKFLPDPERIDWSATLQTALAGEPKGLNPFTDDRTATVVALSVYTLDTLGEVQREDNLQWNARLAARVEESPDHKRYMVYLRKGIRWHDPEPAMLNKHEWLRKPRFVTAHDVKFGVDIIMDPNTTSPLKFAYDKLEKVIAHNDHLVEFVWKEESYYSRSTTMDVQPIPAHIWGSAPDGNPYSKDDVGAQFSKHWFGKSMCGNGPYRFVEYRRGEFIRLERSESYYGLRATCKEWYVHIIPDDQARMARFWNNGLAYTTLPIDDYRRLVLDGDEQRPLWEFEERDAAPPAAWDFTYFLWRRPTYGGFGWNQRKKILSDKRVRKALTHALNRGQVIDKIFYGLGEQIPVGQSVFSPYFPKHLKPLAFDLDAARKLLDEAGWKDSDGDGILDKQVDGQKTDLEFTLLISASSPNQKQIVQIYKNDLLAIGVKMVPDPSESALWSRKIHDREFDGFIIFWTAGLDSDPKQIWESKRADDVGSSNYTGFKNEEADGIFERLHKEFDTTERVKLFHRWYDIQFEENPYTWIWSVKSPVVVNGDWRIPTPQLPTPKIDARLSFRWKTR